MIYRRSITLDLAASSAPQSHLAGETAEGTLVFAMSTPLLQTFCTRPLYLAARLYRAGGLLACVATLGGCQQQWAQGLGSPTGTATDTTQLAATQSTGSTSSSTEPTTQSFSSNTPSTEENAPVPASCGNGIVEAPEQCDDGNPEDGDACLNNCTLARCGDGVLWKGQEACDDGNKDNGDACLQDCNPARCGDGFIHVGQEGCDDGNQVETDACLSDCTPARCGDAVIWLGREACDDGNSRNEDNCLNTCRFNVCGDGFVGGPNEQCDDGNQIDNDGCTRDCKSPTCGDGILNAQEECDDGNSDENDGCLSTCRNATCGDGKVWTGIEQCDPMDTVTVNLCSEHLSSDITLHDPNAKLGCSAECTNDTSPCAYCGDDVVQSEHGEVCDGPVRCDDTRVDDRYYDSNAHFAECTNTCGSINATACGFCGDGQVQNFGSEECDDANNDNSDACVQCQNARCGDGEVWAGEEECDPGSVIANIPQVSTCAEACGDRTEPAVPLFRPTRACHLVGANACQYQAWDCSNCREPEPTTTTGGTDETSSSTETESTTGDTTQTTTSAESTSGG